MVTMGTITKKISAMRRHTAARYSVGSKVENSALNMSAAVSCRHKPYKKRMHVKLTKDWDSD